MTDALTDALKAYVAKKKPGAPLEKVRCERLSDGFCLQMLHTGCYDDEYITFSVMEKYCADNGYRRTQRSHKEIYLSDPQKTPPEKLKTALRFGIGKI
ncbi:MAG: GyrI-like domain-containing protein [Eubacteriales bacterium]|nr:GyrI-like domain-containing protein [Eubacteriales bacterium]